MISTRRTFTFLSKPRYCGRFFSTEPQKPTQEEEAKSSSSTWSELNKATEQMPDMLRENAMTRLGLDDWKPFKPDHKAERYTPEELEQRLEQLKGQGETPIWEILPANKRTTQKIRNLILYFNVPAIGLMTVLPQLPWFTSLFAPEKFSTIFAIMSAGDVVLCLNSYIMYKLISTMVHKITYNADTNQFTFTGADQNNILLTPTTEQIDAGDLKKIKGLKPHPFLGYMHIKDKREFSTEGSGKWVERQLMDSLVHPQDYNPDAPVAETDASKTDDGSNNK